MSVDHEIHSYGRVYMYTRDNPRLPDMTITQQRRHLETVVHQPRHSPTLETQLMVESCIRDHGSFPSKRALLRALPRQMEPPTLVTILKYLEASNKVFLSEDGSIVWVFTDNPKFLRLLKESPAIRSRAH